MPPNAKTLVTSATLKASVTKSDPDQVVFTVTQPPHYGELLVDQRQKISQFTQQDVDLGRISYHQNVPITQWVARDTFQFTIAVNTSVGTDQIFEELDEHRFKITISYAALQDSTLRNYIIISPVRLSEGGRVVVNSTYLNVTALSSIAGSNLQMEVTRLPQHGYLEFRGRNVTGDLRFTQMDLVNKLLVYCHTGRGRQAWVDRVSLDVYPISDLMNGKSSKNLLKLRFNLDFLVSSANKERFHDPIYRRTITVVRGFHYNITRDDLFTDDPDTLPNEIIYSIVQGPTNGFFTYFDNPTQPLRRFTQADINKMTVRFCQDGTDREGKFIFQVSDGKFDPVSGEVRVVVEPLTLSLVNLTDVLYYQDENIIKLNSSHLGAVTNGPKTEIYYDITKQPLYGEFYKSNRDNRAVSRFSQTDVDNQAIVYVHLNLDSETDKFEFSVSNSLNRITGKWLSITAVPQLQSHPVSVLPGKTLIITSDILDVSKLAIKTESDPVFQVVEFPMYGVLVKMPPRKKEAFVLLDEPDNIEDVTTPITTGWHTSAEERLASNEELILDEDDVKAVRVRRNEVLRSNATFFTFSELRDQRVKYISTLQPSLANMVRDKFVYRLTAKGVKPAKGTFPLVVTPYLGRTPEVITAASPTSELTPPYLPAQPDISTDYTVAICLVSVIIVLAVLIIVVRKVRVELKRQTLQKKKAAAMSTSGLITPKPDLLGTSLYSAMTDSQLHVDTTGGNEQPTRDSSMARSASKQSASGGGVRNGSSNKGVSHYSLASPYHTSMSPKGTNTAGSPNFLSPHEGSDVSASAVARLITFDPGRTEIVSSIPLCRVTPLTPKPSSTCSSSSEDWRYAYHYSSSASEHDSKLSQDKLSLDRNNGSGKGRRGQKPQPKLSRQMKLKDNQYWV